MDDIEDTEAGAGAAGPGPPDETGGATEITSDITGLFDGYVRTTEKATKKIEDDKEEIKQMRTTGEELQRQIAVNAGALRALEDGKQALTDKMGVLNRLLEDG